MQLIFCSEGDGENLGNKQLVSGTTFPYEVVVQLPAGQPETSINYTRDLFENCFNCKMGVHIVEDMHVYQFKYQNSIILHLGHRFTTVCGIQPGQNSIYRSLVGMEFIQYYYQKMMQARYGQIFQNMGDDGARLAFYMSAHFIADGETDSFLLYKWLVNKYIQYNKTFARPDITQHKPCTVPYLQENSHNVYKFLKQFNDIIMVPTGKMYNMLFAQSKIIELREGAEKMAAVTIQKILTLSSAPESVLQEVTQLQLEKFKYLYLLKYVMEQIKKEQLKYKALQQNYAQSVLDNICDMDEFKDSLQVLDLHKLKAFQGTIIENLNFCMSAIIYKLRTEYETTNKELPEQLVGLAHLPLAYFYENTVCDENGQIHLPIFLEGVNAVEILFNSQQVGFTTENVAELLNKTADQFVKQRFDLIIAGGGSTIPNVDKRIIEAIRAKQKIAKVQVLNENDEWRMLAEYANQAKLSDNSMYSIQ